jgi:hypothetical protein
METSLCLFCQEFITEGTSDVKAWLDGAFRHYPGCSVLRASTSKGCHLCMLLCQGLLDSRSPEGELDLPERQIKLGFAKQDLCGNGIRIETYVKPANDVTTGRHDFKETPAA